MKHVAIASLAVAIAAPAFAQTAITQWNFNGPSATTVPGGTAAPTTSTGSGVASLIGGVTASFASGAASGGSSDPVTTAPPNYAWGLTSFPAQSTGSGSAGAQFAVSTAGYENISIRWDTRFSNTSNRFLQLLYSIDGTTFGSTGLANDGIFENVSGGDTWSNGISFSLSSIAGASDNASFVFRIVSVFSPTTGAYVASTSTSTYAATGTMRFDMVTVSGTLIPAPGAVALLGVAGLAAGRRRRVN
ncbi:MAG: PEP-CTERM sorting domain-containing protein [Phycisphaerales bacterium]